MKVFNVPEIRCENAAFDDDSSSELPRILRQIADDIEENPDYEMYRNARDINGNVVGTYRLREVSA